MTDGVITASPLEELLAPLSKSDFLSALRERKLTLLRGTNPRRFSSEFGWQALKRLIERGQYPRGKDDIRVTRESVLAPMEDWSKSGKVDPGKLELHLAKGYSVCITHIDTLLPSLAALCAEIKSELHEASYAGVIITTGIDGAFERHYDPEDLIIVQVEGTKRWQIFGPPVSHPVKGMPKQHPPHGEPFFDEVLQPGDLLLLPGGNWHHCENGPGRSVHLGIFLDPPAVCNAIRALTSQMLAEELFRIPLTRVQGEPELAALEAEVRQRLQERIAQLSLAGFLNAWKSRPKA